ncbi:hypothetical protein [Allorhodopirellula solitaria]|uniref:hypothetical protein n=1 Tax=Allorhodopirellula solitaria TaxID=2527987 RepID=UPI0016489723|nr:hypothetical protein [Allorhodopirellula solitaria]
MQLITKASELMDDIDADYLSCLAAAYAEQGDFKSAVSSQRKALHLTSNDEERENMQLFIKSYEAGEPCWMEPPTWRQRWA